MNKFLKMLLIAIFLILVLGLLGLHIAYTSFSPGDKGIPVNKENLVYFQDSYDECRAAFLEKAEEIAGKYDSVKLFKVKVPGRIDQELYIDLLYIPPKGSCDRLLVMSSGVHGAEGFTGSAVQQMFLEELMTEKVHSEIGVLMIHGVNPYGFKYLRRVTENNVDLNRGSDTDRSLFTLENPGYTALYDMINPQGKVSTRSLRNRFFYLVTISKMLKESMSVLRQAIVQGQYEHPEGLFFGGKEFEPQIDSLARILPDYLSSYKTILNIDLHTGYGSRRVLHLFPNPIKDPEIKAKTEFVFDGYHIDWGDSEGFYTAFGGFTDAFMPDLCPDATYLYMVFEWGTSDTEKTFGSIKSLQTMINENQGFHYGYKNERQAEKVVKTALEQYYPDSEAWRSEVLSSGRKILLESLENYMQLEP